MAEASGAPPGARGAPGWAVAVFDAASVKERWLHGEADLERGEPVDPRTRFRWFSVTKAVTAMTILSLAEDGTLSLDDPVHRHLPWVDPASARTVRDLLAHRAGIAVPNPVRWARPPGSEPIGASRLTRRTYRKLGRRHRPPGPARYSNLGFLLLGEVVREATGAPFEEAARTRVLEPLGLGHTSFEPRGAAVGHERLLSIRAAAMSVLFLPRTPRLLRYTREGWVGLTPYEIDGAAYGGLVGSLEDLVTLGQAQLSERWSAMRQEHGVGPEGRFGLGLWLYDDGWVGHGGSAGGYRAELMLHPGRGVGVAVLANGGDASALEVCDRIRAQL